MSKKEKRFVKTISSCSVNMHYEHMIAIFENPNDYPSKCVGRLWVGDRATDVEVVKNNKHEIRRLIPSYYARSSRYANGDPAIVETWHW